MKYLHLFQNEKFTEPYIEFINENFYPNEHLFLIIGQGINAKITNRENVIHLSKDFRSIITLIKKMYMAEKIILHSLFTPMVVKLLSLQPWLLKKSNWVVWGGDLYSYETKKNSFQSKINELFRRIVIKNIREISTLVKGDYNLAKNWYNTKAKYFHAVYMNTERNAYLKDIVERSNNNSTESTIIQIGNSADPRNNHKDVLNLLKRYKDENIKIYCPLSYGDKGYAKEVICLGEKIYGNKFIPLEKFMEISEYMNFLESVDIGIFNNDRQQALGNIYPLLYIGKKIYLRSDTTMWSELNKELNVFDIESIKLVSFEDFKTINTELIERNRERLEPRFNNDVIKKVWENIFHTNK